jgi:hypothetical protein
MTLITEVYTLELKNSEVFLKSVFMSHIDKTAGAHVLRSVKEFEMKHRTEITYQRYRVGSGYPKALRKILI